MPVIKIEKIADRTKTSAKGKKYKVVQVDGTQYGSGEPWSTDIFKNQDDLLEELEEFGPGDTANFVFKKEGNFWNLKEIKEPTEENLEYAKQNGNKPKKTTGGNMDKSSGLTKEEWAEKDRLTNIRIAKAVAVKAAIDTGKKTVKTITAMADELLPYLLDTSTPSPFVEDDDDALDPPVD